MVRMTESVKMPKFTGIFRRPNKNVSHQHTLNIAHLYRRNKGFTVKCARCSFCSSCPSDDCNFFRVIAWRWRSSVHGSHMQLTVTLSPANFQWPSQREMVPKVSHPS